MLAADDPLQRRDSFVYAELQGSLSFPYSRAATASFVLLDPSLSDRVGRMAQQSGTQRAEGEYVRAYYYRMRRECAAPNELLRLAIEEYPADETLRLEFLRPGSATLANDKAPAEIVEIAAGLKSQASIAVAGSGPSCREIGVQGAGTHGCAAGGGAVDERWYPEAVELRVNWRIRVTNAEQIALRRRSDLDDRSAAIMSPTLNLYGLRTRAGFVGRPARYRRGIGPSNYARLGHAAWCVRVNRRSRCERMRRRCAEHPR